MPSPIVAHLNALPDRQRARALRNLKDACELVRAAVQRELGRQGSARDHAPRGTPPRRQTGRLQGSIEVVVDAAALTGRVVSDVPYAAGLETTHPYVAPVLRRLKGELDAVLARP